jgi:subtilisin family serine protease
MLIVVSAGNDGDNRKWRVISTPADAQGVLSVGATPGYARQRISYSGIGPEALPYIKPNVACFSMTGTSFSAPVITGMAACLLQKNPGLSNKQIIDIIEKAGHLYPYGNNYIGYGVPLSYKALAFAQDTALLAQGDIIAGAREQVAKGKSITLAADTPGLEWVVVFHKKSLTHVLEQQSMRPRKGKVTVKRPEGAVRSTVDLGSKVVELVWE